MVKAHLAELEQEGDKLRSDLSARQLELSGFEQDFGQTQLQANAIEKTYRQLQAEHHNV